MSDMHFQSSSALYFLWLLPLVLFVFRYLDRRHTVKLNRAINEKLRPLLTSTVSHPRRKWKRRLQLIATALMLIAYARPQTNEGRQTVKNEGIEILFLVDVSNSMLAEDIRPSRLQLLKGELGRFVSLSGGDRMGLVAFAGSAALLSPMTTDQEAIRLYLESLSVDVVSTQGTNLTAALQEAREAFARGGLGDQEGSQVTRAIVIASDGEDHEPGAYDEAKKLVEDGVYIFTLGFGTEAGGPIPMRDDQGILRGYKKGEDGKEVMTKTKGTVLKELARVGRGSFHHATFQGNAVNTIRSEIEQLKKAEFESGEVKSYNEWFQPILVVAFLVALLEIVLGDRKGKGRIWRGRFEVAGE